MKEKINLLGVPQPKHIEMRIYNSFFNKDVITVTMPHNPYKSIFGTYTRMYKNTRRAMANVTKCDEYFVKGEVRLVERKGEDVEVRLPSGFTLLFPDDINATDKTIILNHLENLRLSLT